MIKNIIFDVGDVLIEYRWKEMFMEYGASAAEAVEIGGYIFGHKVWKLMDKGELTLMDCLRTFDAEHSEWHEYLVRLFDNTREMPVARPAVWDKIRQLKERGYRIYILSNYSEKLFADHTRMIPILNIFDGIVVSYCIGMLKPDREIYEYILDKYDLVPHETVFFDDKEENAAGACEIGINGIWTDTQEKLLEEINGLMC